MGAQVGGQVIRPTPTVRAVQGVPCRPGLGRLRPPGRGGAAALDPELVEAWHEVVPVPAGVESVLW